MAKARLSAQQQAIKRGGKGEPQEDEFGRLVLYGCHPGPQTTFKDTMAQEVLYGGSLGGGKSYALRAWAVRYCLTYPGAQLVLFRSSYRELEETHILAIQQEIPSSIAYYAAGSHNLIFTNGSILMFRFCEKESDVRSYDSAEFDAILFDELTAFTKFQYVYLLTRCRSTKPWWPGRMIRAGATPMGIGHSWVKERWIDPPEAAPNKIWKGPDAEGGMTRQFIPARAIDNPALMKMDPNYMAMLRALPEEEYRAKALGDWNVQKGKFFTRWRDPIHTYDPFDIPPDWDRFICHDYGFNAPFATYWFARPPNTETAWVYRERYGTGVKHDEQVREAYHITEEHGEKIRGVVLDPSMFSMVNVKGDRVAAMSKDWERAFAGISPVIRGNNERVSGWRLIRSMLDWEEAPNGKVLLPPRLHISRSCPNLTRTLPLLIADERNVEDLDTRGEDHGADALRYGLQHAFGGRGQEGYGGKLRISPDGLARTRK